MTLKIRKEGSVLETRTFLNEPDKVVLAQKIVRTKEFIEVYLKME